MSFRILFYLIIFFSPALISQIRDTISYSWPISPMNTQKEVTGTFGEYRDTDAAGHYHNGTDIPAPAGTPVLAVLGGTVVVAYDDGNTGYDSYVRIASVINGQTKYLTYYHTRPTVSVGQVVTVGQQISTIAIDHVHLIDYRIGAGLSNTHLNCLRPDGGLKPYNDIWKPHVRYVKFFLDNSNVQLQPMNLGGRVDIFAHVEEENGIYSSSKNNGGYEVGYGILALDSATVIYSPPDNGIRFRYYNIPKNDYVNINYYKPESSTSKHVYQLTNGQGAEQVSSTQIVSNNYWNTDLHPKGNYIVQVFTKDSRGNADTVLVPVRISDLDLIPPQAPILHSVLRDSANYFTISWTAPPDSDLKGYRLFYSTDGTNFLLRDNEVTLNADVTSRTYYYNLSNPLYLKLFAVDNSSLINISTQSDVYGIKSLNNSIRILIVDGFDRYGGPGSWNKDSHDFFVKYAEVLNYGLESCHHTQIDSNKIDLTRYNAVIWMSGDESYQDTIFTTNEKVQIRNYLENGGNLFITGSEIALAMDGISTSGIEDSVFLSDVLRVKFKADDANISYAVGADSGFAAGIIAQFGVTSAGSPYVEDSPDIIDTINGSKVLFRYPNTTNIAGVYYEGPTGNSVLQSKVVFLAFPFETIGNKTHRTQLVNSVLSFFELGTTGIENNESNLVTELKLGQNYPNPFNSETKIEFSLRDAGTISIDIVDILGNTYQLEMEKFLPAGSHTFTLNMNMLQKNFPSGVYFFRIKHQNRIYTTKLLYLK